MPHRRPTPSGAPEASITPPHPEPRIGQLADRVRPATSAILAPAERVALGGVFRRALVLGITIADQQPAPDRELEAPEMLAPDMVREAMAPVLADAEHLAPTGSPWPANTAEVARAACWTAAGIGFEARRAALHAGRFGWTPAMAPAGSEALLADPGALVALAALMPGAEPAPVAAWLDRQRELALDTLIDAVAVLGPDGTGEHLTADELLRDL